MGSMSAELSIPAGAGGRGQSTGTRSVRRGVPPAGVSSVTTLTPRIMQAITNHFIPSAYHDTASTAEQGYERQPPRHGVGPSRLLPRERGRGVAPHRAWSKVPRVLPPEIAKRF